MTDYISREAAIKRFNFAVLDCLGMEPTIRAGDIIKALESIPAADVRPVEWIPVTERLPLLNTPVLATDGIEVDISWMYGVQPRWITSYTAIDEDKLTHWMPLPQTPKEE